MGTFDFEAYADFTGENNKFNQTAYVKVGLIRDRNPEKNGRLGVRVRTADGEWEVPDGWDESFEMKGTSGWMFGVCPANCYSEIARFLELTILQSKKLDPEWQQVLMKMDESDMQKTADGVDVFMRRPFTDEEMLDALRYR